MSDSNSVHGLCSSSLRMHSRFVMQYHPPDGVARYMKLMKAYYSSYLTTSLSVQLQEGPLETADAIRRRECELSKKHASFV